MEVLFREALISLFSFVFFRDIFCMKDSEGCGQTIKGVWCNYLGFVCMGGRNHSVIIVMDTISSRVVNTNHCM